MNHSPETAPSPLQTALAECDQRLALDSEKAADWYKRANALSQLGRQKEAVLSYTKAVALSPEYADAWYNRGNALYALERFEEALKSFERTVEIDPNYTMGWLNRGSALLALHRDQEALECFERTIQLQPNYPEAWMNRGNALCSLFRTEEAVISFERAISLRPQYAEAWYNRANSLNELGLHQLAMWSFERALQLRPNYPDAALNLSLSLLRQGNFRDGWRLYEARWGMPSMAPFRRPFNCPMWQGHTPVAGKRLLLHVEQGLGDTIQFSRHATELARLGARVILEVQPPLVALLNELEGVEQVVAAGSELPPFDLHCPLLSLPLALGSGIDTPISGAPYLKADEEKKSEWAERLGPKRKPRIGIVWSGNPKFSGDQKRSLTAEQFVPHLPEGFDYICLQKELKERDKELVTNSSIRFFGDELHDFTDTAALCSLMDLVVTSCTSMAHLSGSLGMPTWVMLAKVADFRWLLDRSDSPWYDSARLFRQKKLGDWTELLGELSSALTSREWEE